MTDVGGLSSLVPVNPAPMSTTAVSLDHPLPPRPVACRLVVVLLRQAEQADEVRVGVGDVGFFFVCVSCLQYL